MPCLQLATEEPGKGSGGSSSSQGRDISDSSRQSHNVEPAVMYEHELPATDNLAQSLGRSYLDHTLVACRAHGLKIQHHQRDATSC